MDMTLNEHEAFQIKGHREGLIITLGDGEWHHILESLLDHISARRAFFRGARVAFDAGSRSLTIAEITSLRTRLSDLEVSLWALQTKDERTTKSLRNLGLETSIPSFKTETKVKPFDTLIAGEDALLVKKTLRSGYRVVYAGHVIVLGDVNPGAEIVAGGSVVVWGRARGSIHAGAEGDESAVVCALEMNPTQVRIASISALQQQPKKGKPQPEICSVNNGTLKTENWKTK